MTETAVKKPRLSGPLIGTHNGRFHADEALAVYMLRLLPAYRDSPLVRTRDPSILETCHTVVDVGGQYEAERLRFDHHQREFQATFPSHSTKLSSAGLVYKHFGQEIIAQQTGSAVASEEVGLLWKKMYDDLIEAFDANDNGISQYDTKTLESAGIEKRFSDRNFSLASVVSRLNDHYDDDTGKTAEQLQAEEDERFSKASTFTGQQFLADLQYLHKKWLPARHTVNKAFESRTEYDERGRIMVLREGGTPWTTHLFELEASSAEKGDDRKVLYVLFPENPEPQAKWRIRAVPASPNGGFENRLPLPEAWRGVRDQDLDSVTGISGCVFVHAGGFIGGNKSFDGALQMAKKAVDIN